jgi:long-chain acyl-CoA synthetase
MAQDPPSATRRNLQTFLSTLAGSGRRGSFARAGAVRRIERSPGQVLAAAGAASGRLRGLGIVAGDRVILLMEDGPDWVSAFAACLALGAVAVPLEATSRPEFVESVARRCGARAILADGGAIAGGALPVVAFDEPGIEAGAPLGPVADPDPSDLAEIVFTSGTTAEPRGVMITHRNFLTAIAGIEAGIDRRRGKLSLVSPITMISLVPLSHLFGQALGLFIPAILDARVLFSPSRPARSLLALAKREKAWVAVTVPRHLAALREHMEARLPRPKGRLSRRWWVRAARSIPAVREHGWRLRTFVVGGARLDPEIEGYFKDLGYLVVQGYGLTETAPIVSVSNPFDPRVGLIGRPGRAMEVKIAPDGEILIKGENVTTGYWGDEEATRGALRDGWLHTGDLGLIEADGLLRLLGRKKEVIVTGEGQNVYPDEVEEALRSSPAVVDAAVFASGGAGGEQVHAAIIPAAAGGAGSPAVASAVAEVNARLAAHQRVRGWSLWGQPDFPRTPTGKVIRRAVAAALTGGSRPPAAGGGAIGAGMEGDPLALLHRLAGGEAGTDQKFGADLGLTSIDVAELAAAIEERFQVEIDPAKIHEDASLAELMAEARSGREAEARWRMPRWTTGWTARAARGLLQTVIVFPILWLLAKLAVVGEERVPPPGLPLLIVANHASHLDVPLLLASMPRSRRRRVAVAMQPEYFEPWLRGSGSLLTRLHMGWHYRLVGLLLNTFPFPRSAAFKIAMEHAGGLVDRGWSILVFPEGELSRDGEIHGFRPGVGKLAGELKLEVLPARIRGAWAILPRGRWLPRAFRSPVSVTWGPVIAPVSGEDPAAFAARVEERIRSL